SVSAQLCTLHLPDALPISTVRTGIRDQHEIDDILERMPGRKPEDAASPEALILVILQRGPVHIHGLVPGIGPIVSRSPRLSVAIDRKSTRLNSSHVKISYA